MHWIDMAEKNVPGQSAMPKHITLERDCIDPAKELKHVVALPNEFSVKRVALLGYVPISITPTC